MNYPSESVAKAKAALRFFDRVSADTRPEAERLRSLLGVSKPIIATSLAGTPRRRRQDQEGHKHVEV